MFYRSLSFAKTVLNNRKRKDNSPRFLTYTVTFGCNARCIMCDSWKKPTQGDLTTDEVENIFQQLPQMDAIRLTGGEPFVRKDMLDIHEMAIKFMNPMLVHVTSNGFLPDRIVDFCEKRSRKTPLHLLISIDGVGEKHNHIRGNSKAYDLAVETIERLAPRKKELNFRLAVNQTIVDAEGVEHYRKLREVLRPLGVYNNVVMAYDQSATYSLESEVDMAPKEIGQFTTFGDFNDETLKDLLKEVKSDLHELSFFERQAKKYYLRGIENRLLHDKGTPNPPCVALNSHLRIFPNGDVPTCQFNTRTIGNLRDQTFEEVWKSQEAAAQRTWVRKCAGCWAECEVLPSALYTLDILKS